jgi:hypothetical protein
MEHFALFGSLGFFRVGIAPIDHWLSYKIDKDIRLLPPAMKPSPFDRLNSKPWVFPWLSGPYRRCSAETIPGKPNECNPVGKSPSGKHFKIEALDCLSCSVIYPIDANSLLSTIDWKQEVMLGPSSPSCLDWGGHASLSLLWMIISPASMPTYHHYTVDKEIILPRAGYGITSRPRKGYSSGTMNEWRRNGCPAFGLQRFLQE